MGSQQHSGGAAHPEVVVEDEDGQVAEGLLLAAEFFGAHLRRQRNHARPRVRLLELLPVGRERVHGTS